MSQYEALLKEVLDSGDAQMLLDNLLLLDVLQCKEAGLDDKQTAEYLGTTRGRIAAALRGRA